MKRFAAILVVAAALSGTAPVAALAGPVGGSGCSGGVFPLTLIAYC